MSTRSRRRRRRRSTATANIGSPAEPISSGAMAETAIQTHGRDARATSDHLAEAAHLHQQIEPGTVGAGVVAMAGDALRRNVVLSRRPKGQATEGVELGSCGALVLEV